MIIGIGTDIIEIERIKKALERSRFKERVYTDREIAYCESRGKQAASSFAARFSAKEAVAKAFGTGFISDGRFLDIEILPDELGCPRVKLAGFFENLAEEKRVSTAHISLSHSEKYATADCVLEVRE